MSNIRNRYKLYRAVFVRHGLFAEVSSPSQIMADAIAEQPSITGRRNSKWHLGNLDYFNKSEITGFFAIGKTTKSTLAVFDETTKKFNQVISETSPFTFCIFDTQIGLVAIQENNELAATKQLAKRLVELFSQTHAVKESHARVEMRPIPSSHNFITKLRDAKEIKSFTATFRGPNPFDADEHFQQPLAELASFTAASEGKTTLRGTSLKKEPLIELARSAASTGNKASARIIPQARGARPKTITLGEDAAELNYTTTHTSHESVVLDMRNLYKDIRSDGNH